MPALCGAARRKALLCPFKAVFVWSATLLWQAVFTKLGGGEGNGGLASRSGQRLVVLRSAGEERKRRRLLDRKLHCGVGSGLPSVQLLAQSFVSEPSCLGLRMTAIWAGVRGADRSRACKGLFRPSKHFMTSRRAGTRGGFFVDVCVPSPLRQCHVTNGVMSHKTTSAKRSLTADLASTTARRGKKRKTSIIGSMIAAIPHQFVVGKIE